MTQEEIKPAIAVGYNTYIVMHFDLTQARLAKEMVGLALVVENQAIAEEITNNPFAIELGRLLCLAAGNPEGCVPLRVAIKQEFETPRSEFEARHDYAK